MSVDSNNVARRKRKAPPRRTPAIIEQRERRPFIFGWGADLTRREREALKERIALFGGIALALVLAIILGWGWLQDNVITPANVAAENNKPVAVVGNYVIRMGMFKKYENFEQTQLNNQLTQIQQQVAQLQAQPKKNAATIQQLQLQQSTIQQQLGSMATNTLTTLIDNETVLQRSAAAGVPITTKLINSSVANVERQAGGRQHLIDIVNQSGMSYNDFRDQFIVAPAVQTKLQTKLAAQVAHYQIKVRASHILIASTKKPLAEQLYHEVLNGANFAALAKKYSIDPGSAKKGGDLGYFAHGAMVAPFDKAAFSMKVGEIRLIKSQYGWHIIKVTGREHAKLTPQEYQNQQQAAFQTWLTSQQAKLHVQRLIAPTSLPSPVATTVPVAPANPVPNSQVPPSTAPHVVPKAKVPVVPGKKTTVKKSTKKP